MPQTLEDFGQCFKLFSVERERIFIYFKSGLWMLVYDLRISNCFLWIFYSFCSYKLMVVNVIVHWNIACISSKHCPVQKFDPTMALSEAFETNEAVLVTAVSVAALAPPALPPTPLSQAPAPLAPPLARDFGELCVLVRPLNGHCLPLILQNLQRLTTNSTTEYHEIGCQHYMSVHAGLPWFSV